MNKHVNFEDIIFTLNTRIRMLGDLLLLDIDTELFFQKSIDDLKFIGFVLETLTEKLIANPDFPNREREADNILDAEWQFNRLLSKFAGESSPFSAALFPELRGHISGLLTDSNTRCLAIDKFNTPLKHYQPEAVVSQAELSGLLKGV